jgi:RES domain-containing protein
VPEAWRIVKAKYASSAFSGEGAARAGGRWNSRGHWLVYTSATKALAALELLVHLNPPVLFEYMVIRADFPEALVIQLAPEALPGDWRAQPAPPSVQAIGDRWVEEASSAILRVPSVVIPSEWNYLLNPAHPDFRKIQLGKPEPFAFDPRLLT